MSKRARRQILLLLTLLATSLICYDRGWSSADNSDFNEQAQEERAAIEWETHRWNVKVPAHLFPNAAAVWLYFRREGIQFASNGDMILPPTRIRLTEIEVRQLRDSVFYGPGPNVLFGCGPRLRYAFRFVDKDGNALGTFLYWFDGYDEIRPASPPSSEMHWLVIDRRRVDGIVRKALARMQMATVGSLPCGA